MLFKGLIKLKSFISRVKLLQKKEEEEDDWSSSSRNSKIIYENMTDILKAKNSRNSSIQKLENHLVDDKNFPSFTEDCGLTNQVATNKAMMNQLKYSSSRIKCLSSSGNKQKRMSLDCSSTLAAALLPTPDDTSVISNHRPPKLATLRGDFEKRKPTKAGKNKTYVPQFAPLPSIDHDDDIIQRSLGLDNKCNSNTNKPIINIIKGSHNSKAADDNSCHPDEYSSRISKVTKTIQQVCQSSNSNPPSSTIAISKDSQKHRLLASPSTGDKSEPTDSIIINPQNNSNKQCSTTKKLLISFRKNNNNSNKKNYGSNTRKAECDANAVQKIPDKIEACCKSDFSTQAAAKTHQHVDELESNSSNGIPPPPSRSDSGYCSWDNSISYYHNNTDPLCTPLTTLAKNDLSSEEAGKISEATTRELKLLPTTLSGPTTYQAGQNSSSVAKLLKKGNSMKIPLKYCKSNFTSNSSSTTTTKTVTQPESCKKSEIMSSKKIGPLHESFIAVNQKENYFDNQNNNHIKKIIQAVVPHQQGTIINFMDQDFEGAELEVRRLLPCVPEMLKEEKVDVEKQQQDDEFYFKSESEDGYCEEDNSIVNYYSPLKGLRLDKKEGGSFPFLDQESKTFKLLPMDHHHQQQLIHNNLSTGISPQNQPPDNKISSNVCYYSDDSDSSKKMGPNKVFFHVRQKSREECEFETLLRQNFTAEHDEQQQPDNSHDANPLNFYNLRNILTQDIDDNVLTDLYKTFNIPCNTTTNTNKNSYVPALRHNGTVNDSNDRFLIAEIHI